MERPSSHSHDRHELFDLYFEHSPSVSVSLSSSDPHLELFSDGTSLIVGVVVLYCYLAQLSWVYLSYLSRSSPVPVFLFFSCLLDGVGTCRYGLFYLLS